MPKNASSRQSPLPRNRLVEARYHHNWSQQQVADQIGTTALNVSRWERGLTTPASYFRNKLCALFGVTAIELGLLSETLPAQETKEGDTEPLKTPQSLYDPGIPIPTAITPLVGREQEIETLRSRLFTTRAIALCGLPGIGKTALAIHLAYDPEVRRHFAAGILWAGLGTAPNSLSILSRWGELLGISPSEARTLITVEAWARVIRAAIGQRAFLLVLDDAWTLDDALACQVGGSHCSYLLTTRFPQIALSVANEQMRVIKELDAQESRYLLTLLAPEVMAQEAEQVEELLREVGGIPFALKLMGNYLRLQGYSKQPRRIRAAIVHLQAAQARLQLTEMRPALDHSTTLPGTSLSLQAVIEVSDYRLSEQCRAAVRALSVLPAKPNSFSEEAALAVCQAQAETLDALSDAGLLESVGPERYTLHQVIRDYAQFHLQDDMPYKRCASYYVAYAQAHVEQYSALEREIRNIVAALDAAFAYEQQHELVAGVVAFSTFLHARGMYSPAKLQLARGEAAAKELGLEEALATIFLVQGQIEVEQGNIEQALAHLQEGLAIARQRGNRKQETLLLTALVQLYGSIGKHDEVEQYAQDALILARQYELQRSLGAILDRLGVLADLRSDYALCIQYKQEALEIAQRQEDYVLACNCLLGLGVTVAKQGRYEAAVVYWQEGLTLARRFQFHSPLGMFLANLGRMAVLEGNYPQAELYFQEGMVLAKQLGVPSKVALFLKNFSELAAYQENYPQAEEYLQQALALLRPLEKHFYIFDVFYGLGEVYLKQHKLDQAEEMFREVQTWASPEEREFQARGLYGRAQVAAAREDNTEALRLGHESLVLLEEIGHEFVEPVKAWLATLA